jgi:hypothetical protein
MINLQRLNAWLFPDCRPEWEKSPEREFSAVSELKSQAGSHVVASRYI